MVNLATSLGRLRVDRQRLARHTGLSQARIDEIFDGGQPTTSELRKIAQYLRVPADSLIRTEPPSTRFQVRYRRNVGPEPPTAAELRMQEISCFLTRNDLVPDGLRNWQVEAELEDRRSIENAASRVRALICDRHSQLDPLPDLVDRIDRAGLASSVVLSDLDVEGASTNAGGRGLIVVAARTFAPRKLFICAHELAHIILGHTRVDEWLIDEDTIEAFDLTNSEERLCNALASAILQPAEGVARFLETVRRHLAVPQDAITATEILLVARYYCTSFAAAAMRLEQLEIVPAGTAASFERAVGEDYNSLERYAQEAGLPPRTRIDFPAISCVFRACLAESLDSGQISIGRLGEVLGYSSSEMVHALS